MPRPPSASLVEQSLEFRDWACLRYHLIWGYDGPIPAESRKGRFRSEDESCWLIRRGRVRLKTEAGEVTAGPGRWVFVGREPRAQTFSEDAELLSLNFRFAWPGGEPVLRQAGPLVVEAADHPRLERAALPLIRELGRLAPRAGLRLPMLRCSLKLYLQIQNLLPIWLAAYVEAQERRGNRPRRPGPLDERVMRAAATLDRQPLAAGFPAGLLRRESGVGRSRLNELFLRAVGRTPRRYFDDRRGEEARSLLRHTGRSVKQIAFELGFRHESHFSLWFKRREGASPLAWRTR